MRDNPIYGRIASSTEEQWDSTVEEARNNQAEQLGGVGRTAAAGRGLGCSRCRVEASPEPERHVHEADHHGHLDEGSDHCREGRAAIDPKHRDGHRDRQLEVVAGGSEREGCGLGVVCADAPDPSRMKPGT